MAVSPFGRPLLQVLALAWGSVASAAAQEVRVGAPLPRWTPGSLEIHQISTGRGNSALFIMPDGTTLLVDAGAAGDGLPETDPHPDATREPGEWIARYIKRHIPDTAAGLDYALITHFHADHYGQLTPRSPLDPTGAYRMAGITQVGTLLKIHTLIDRGWPDYSYPAPLTDSTMANYRRFLDVQRSHGMIVERFKPGSPDQIRARNVQVRNIIGNGDAWTGVGDGVRSLFPPIASLSNADWPNENMCSLGIRITYGAFRYFTGGDLPGTADPGFPAWHAIEPAIASVIGPVNVHVVNQHGSMGEESEPFVRTLASTVVIIPSWAASHPAPDVLKRIINSRYPPAERAVFATDMRDATRIVIGPRANAVTVGHVVVRVDPGGSRYVVAVLSNQDERDSVIAVKGPFDARP
jgi:beta-lactamase superfamily II metal-dependent hydrolase